MRPHHHEGARQRFAKIAEQCDIASIFTKAHCGNGGNLVDWLVEDVRIDLSLIARLGGHSAPCTHHGKERSPDLTVTYALIQMVEKTGERSV